MPHNFLLDALIYICVGFGAVVPLFYLNVKFARVLGLIDWPKARGMAEEHVPIVGPSLIVVALVTLGVLMPYFNVSPWIITSAAIIGIMGYFDDRRPMPALDKMFFQAICSVAVVYLDPHISASLGDRYGAWGLVFGALFILFTMNAINFIDGIDGLAGIVLLSAFGIIPFMGSAQTAAYPYVILSCVAVGALLPFLYLNVQRRKGFLGNVGSYFFSFLAAVAHLSLPLEMSDAVTRLSLAGLCFLVPLADAMSVISIRIATYRSPFRADKSHLHHRLVQTNLPLRQILVVLGMVQLMGVLSAFFFTRQNLIATPYLSTMTLIGYSAITSTLILLLEKASRIRVQGYFQRLDSNEPIYYLKYRVARNDKNGLKSRELRRLEAKFAAEIRVTDICVAQSADCLFIVLRTMAEPLKGISARLEAVIHSEKEYEFSLIERGDFTKRLGVQATSSPTSRKTA